MSKIINNNRRQFLQHSALGLATAAFPGLLLANAGKIRNRPSPGFKADIEIAMTAREGFLPVLEKGANTRVQKYYSKLLKGPAQTLQHLKGNYLGPIINFEKGQKVRVYFDNALKEPSIIHWHGLHVPQKDDGHPMYSIEPGERFVYEFEVLRNL